MCHFQPITRMLSFLVVLISLTSACDGEPVAGDSGASDSATPSPLVAECEARATAMAANCADARVCMWEGYRELCARGRTQLLLDSMACFSDTTCRTFSSPGESVACLEAVHAAGQSPAARAAITAMCRSCEGPDCDAVASWMELIPYLSDADIALFEECRGNGAACSVDHVITGCSASVPGLAAFAGCL
jgi:hypothetical protein